MFEDPERVILAEKTGEIEEFLESTDKQVNEGAWAVGFLAYEAGYSLLGIKEPFPDLPFPAGAFGIFKKAENVEFPLSNRIKHRENVRFLKSSVDLAGYAKQFGIIKNEILKGNTYQVNFTYNSYYDFEDDAEVFLDLVLAQPTRYCAFCDLAGYRALSFSPELFFSVEHGTIHTEPMKGTAPRGRCEEEDKKLKRTLTEDEKSRAENIMITDLIRNDLGRICRPGSIKVKSLFKIRTLPTVHQMTTGISGELEEDTGIKDVFKALFPCGSVTGAPKRKTMEIIANTENEPRGIYCGALGYIAPQHEKALFSVPIRTFEGHRNHRIRKLGTGGGIVWGSKLSTEWEETRNKRAFAEKKPFSGNLVETLLLQNGRFRYLNEHLRRMRYSAGLLNFPFDKQMIGKAMEDIAERQKEGTYKVRLLLDPAGKPEVKVSEYPSGRNRKVVFSFRKCAKDEFFLFHKTDHRPWYAQAPEFLRENGFFEVIYVNNDYTVSEGSYTNVFVQFEDKLLTPPLDSGVLPGILRKKLLEEGKCEEREITFEMMKSARKVFCGNSVRGLIEVEPVYEIADI